MLADYDDKLCEFYQISTVEMTSFQRDDLAGPLNSQSGQIELRTKSKNPIDPLGFHDSIMDELLDKDIINSTRSAAVMKYLVDSKAFNPRLFLSQIHSDKSFKELSRSLDFLEEDLLSTQDELKRIVKSEHYGFIRSKNALDQIYKQFEETNLLNDGCLENSLKDATTQSTHLFNPVLANEERKAALIATLEMVSQNKFLFNLPNSLSANLAAEDYDTLMTDYKKGVQERKSINGEKSRIFDRFWTEVENIVDEYRQILYNQLARTDLEMLKVTNGKLSDRRFFELISKLVEVGVTENPLLDYVSIQKDLVCDYLDEELENGFVQKIVLAKSKISCSEASLKLLYSAREGPSDNFSVIEVWTAIEKCASEILDKILLQSVKLSFVIDFAQESPDIDLNDSDKQQLHEILEELLKRLFSKLSAILNCSVEGANTVTSIAHMVALQDRIADKFTEATNCGSKSITTPRIIEMFRAAFLDINASMVSAALQNLNTDAKNFKFLENWLKSPETIGCTLMPDFMLFYYSQGVLKQLCKLLFHNFEEDQYHIIPRVASKKMLVGVETQFLRSFDIMLDSIFVQNLEFFQYGHSKGLQVDKAFAYEVYCYTNFSRIESHVLPQVISLYDELFKTNLRSKQLEVYYTLSKLEVELFDRCLSSLKQNLNTMITQDPIFQDPLTISSVWKNPNPPHKVDAYMRKVLLFLVSIKTRLSELATSHDVTVKIFQELANHILDKIFDAFKPMIGDYTVGGLQQVCVDLEFFVAVLGNYLNNEGVKKSENIYRKVIQLNLEKAKVLDSVTGLLQDSLNNCKVEFSCFEKV